MLSDGCAEINQSISAARKAHSSKPTAAGFLLWVQAGRDRQTDRQTPHCYTDPAPHTRQAVATIN